MGSAFAATRYEIVASPCPSFAEVKVTQVTGDVALQEHSRATAMASVPLPPADPNAPDELETVASHRACAGAVRFVVVEAELPHAVDTSVSVRNSKDVRTCTAAG